jgi:hypothetical protein
MGRLKIAKILATVALAGIAASCTYNISMAHTSGQASDVIDDIQTPQNTVSPTIEAPLIGK